jgi:methyl-accepting chemotaxis protein
VKVDASAVERRSRVHAVLNHVSIRVKLGGIAALGVFLLLGLSAVSIWNDHAHSLTQRQAALRGHVETAMAVLVTAHAAEQAGTLTRAQAQTQALATLRAARYAGSEYFFVNDMDHRMVLHPIKPELEGRDVADMKDPQGVPLFRRFVETVKRQQAGFVGYQWPKPGHDRPVDKLSYVQGFAPWGWVLGTGVYTDDLRAEWLGNVKEAAVMIGGALAVLLLAVHLVYESITRGLAKSARVARAIGQGDISAEIMLVGSDEIGDLIAEMKRMSDQLNLTMSEVHASAQQVSQASEEIASANQDLSQRTERTAAHLQRVAATLGQLASSVRHNAEATVQVNRSADEASGIAGRGGEAVGRAVGTMEGLSEASRRIADITSVIDGLAFQTNILALNAAVEAARAGEAGRGFAVVAGEVRQLAQRSAAAAREIKELIGTSVAQTRQGVEMVEHAGQTIARVVESVREVGGLVHGITAANGEQDREVGEIHGAISELDQMTQQNAALVEQSAAAAQALREQAGALAEVVSRFKLAAEQRARHTPPAGPRWAALPMSQPA